jgi:flagellin
MASILTNSSSMAALSTLRSISSQMSTTQERISSGLKVGSAADNAAYWSIATTMKTESSSLSVVGEALGMGSSLADIASVATQSVIDLVGQVRDRVVAAGENTNDKAKIQTELKQLFDQITKTVASAAFNGENWLTKTDATTDVLSGVTAGTLDYITVDLQAGGSNTSAVAATVTGLDISAMDATGIQTSLNTIDTALENLATLGATFGAASSRIDTQKDFISKLTAAIDRGVGSLVDADMNEESTRLKALQTQQQLAVQSLSIANSSSDSILQLFR